MLDRTGSPIFVCAKPSRAIGKIPIDRPQHLLPADLTAEVVGTQDVPVFVRRQEGRRRVATAPVVPLRRPVAAIDSEDNHRRRGCQSWANGITNDLQVVRVLAKWLSVKPFQVDWRDDSARLRGRRCD